MLVCSASRNFASPANAFNSPIRAWPSMTKSHVSCSAWSSQFDFDKRSIRSSTNGDEQGSGIGEAPLNGLAFSQSCMRGRHGVVDVKFSLPAVVEKAEGHVASLLDLGNHESRADGMNRTSWHENDVVLQDQVPLNQVRNRAILDRRTQLGGGKLPLQSDDDFVAGRSGKNIQSLGLALR